MFTFSILRNRPSSSYLWVAGAGLLLGTGMGIAFVVYLGKVEALSKSTLGLAEPELVISTPAVGAVSEIPHGLLHSSVVSSQAVPGHHTLRLPPEFADFEQWPPERQLSVVTDLQKNPSLTPGTLNFLIDLASDPSRRALLRNNAANALGIQSPPVPEWLGKLADQALDSRESSTWRDYALQHLADQLALFNGLSETSSNGAAGGYPVLDRQRYLNVLSAVAGGKDLLAGTALLHLDRLSREKGIHVDRAEFHRLMTQLITDPAVDDGAKITAIGIVGLRAEPSDAHLLRPLLGNSNPDIKRVTIVALGSIGTADDLAAIEGVPSDGDRLIKLAIEGARRRFAARELRSSL